MFIEQIKTSKVSGVLHICDSESIGGNAVCMYAKCSICGAIYFPSFTGFGVVDEVCFDMVQDEFMGKYKECTGDFRTDEEVAEEMKSLRQRIKGWFK